MWLRLGSYFQHVPEHEPLTIYSDEPAGHIAISGTDDDREIEVYNPTETSNKVKVIDDMME